MAIHWGVLAFRIKFSKSPDVTIKRAVACLKKQQCLCEGDRVIVVSDILADGQFIETVQVRII
ncbi:MAG: hypothetical protein PF442_01470 [Desulfobulbaceae bacterium]|nr:hypothetical protein [Desulfobulbaceae bacterium]